MLLQWADASLILINHDLSPGQQRNLEQALNCRMITRTELILTIFAERARSHEGQLQVELAQLKHAQTRLVRGWTHLDRQKGGIGMRGAGEKQIELDQRMLSARVKATEQKLQDVARRRRQNRRSRNRQGTPTVSLVGYTNAGKSTLFNAITQARTAHRQSGPRTGAVCRPDHRTRLSPLRPVASPSRTCLPPSQNGGRHDRTACPRQE